VLYMLVTGLVMGIGVLTQQFIGLYVAVAAFEAASIVQVLWLWLRSRLAARALAERDTASEDRGLDVALAG
jgi:4-amino-4-deoxy-L-arabinose transferase-like glycosyltransferase